MIPRRRAVRSGPTRALLAALACATLFAGCRPTPVDTPPFTRISDAYREARYASFQGVVRDWTLAVGERNVPAVLSLYAPDAVVELDRAASGDELEDAVTRWVGTVESVLTGPADFAVGGDLAYGTVRILVVSREGVRRSGLMVLVLREEAGSWRIRSQLLALRDP